MTDARHTHVSREALLVIFRALQAEAEQLRAEARDVPDERTRHAANARANGIAYVLDRIGAQLHLARKGARW